MVGIYKITNIINHKCYIGQSTNIHKRWNAHRSAAQNPKNRDHQNSHLYRAMRKYGIENFLFEVLEECSVSSLNQKEREYIQKYNSCFNGYNESLGGDCGSHAPKETVLNIIHDLENTAFTQREIAKKNGVTEKWVQYINTGHAWRHDRPYPIRQYTPETAKPRTCVDCGSPVSKGGQRCARCEQARRQWMSTQNKPSKEQLYEALMQYHKFSIVSRMYNVSHTQIRRWCKEFQIPDNANAYSVIKPPKSNRLQNAKRPVSMCDITTGKVLQTFDSASAAEKYFGKSTGAIQRAIAGRRPSAYGYKWIYADSNT